VRGPWVATRQLAKAGYLDGGYMSKALAFVSTRSRLRKPRTFWSLDSHEIPESPGVYLLFARRRLLYPKGRSPVFYIGQASNLRRRLKAHLTYARQAREGRRHTLYWPRYEWAAAFGTRYALVLAGKGQTPRRLEGKILKDFSRKYRSFPLANGQGSW